MAQDLTNEIVAHACPRYIRKPHLTVECRRLCTTFSEAARLTSFSVDSGGTFMWRPSATGTGPSTAPPLYTHLTRVDRVLAKQVCHYLANYRDHPVLGQHPILGTNTRISSIYVCIYIILVSIIIYASLGSQTCFFHVKLLDRKISSRQRYYIRTVIHLVTTNSERWHHGKNTTSYGAIPDACMYHSEASGQLHVVQLKKQARRHIGLLGTATW
jgi:hypothetical protein